MSGHGLFSSRFAVRLLALGVAAAAPLVGAGLGAAIPVAAVGHAQVSPAAHYDTSAPLRDLKNTHTRGVAHAALRLPAHGGQADTKGQAVGGHSGASAALVPSSSTNWEGVGQGFSGPQGTMSVNSAPPDTDGAVGPSDYVQIVNESFAVFSKTGTVLYGPVSTNTLWSGFGGGCQTNNDGDATAVYDRAANRFVISQFSVSTTPYLQCVAVSTTGDPTGSYYRYSFSYGSVDFPDYPKLGVWPDAYYTTFNIFLNGQTFNGAEVAAYNRSAMLNGQAATQQTFTTNTNYGGLLPANVDSSAQPAAGTPEWLVALGFDATHNTTSGLAYWQFHVDWATPANTTFTGPTQLNSQAYSEVCGGGTCVPQAGTSQQLDSLADRVMYSLGYRNFGDHESLVVSQSVAPAAGGGGIAWYELRPSAGALGIYQQGVYAPDTNYRWMPSLAMDGSGDIGLGFSLSSSALHPAVHYTGRLATDAPGTMAQGEASIIDGAGSQTGSIFQPLSRWGDYSQMSIDPSDDCTFWYTNEYEAVSGSFNWHTRIGSFKFSSCGGTVSNDFSMGVTPAAQTVTAGSSTSYTVTTAVTSGSAQTINLSAGGLPSGATASFNPASVTAGGSSTMTVSTTSGAATGTSSLTVTGTGTSATHTATASLTISAPPANDFSIAVSPGSQTVAAGSGTSYSVSTAVTSGSAQTVSLSATGQPAGVTVSFNPTSVTAGGGSTMTVSTAANTAPGTYVLTVTGTGTSATHSTTTSLTVSAPPDFTVSAAPSGQSVTAGSPATYTVTVGSTNGFNGAVGLSASGTLSGDTYSFNPSSVTPPAGGTVTSTLTVNTSSAGGDTITVSGTAGSTTHTTSVSLTVNAACTPDFSVSASPASITVKRGQTASYSVSATPSCGFSGTVAWSVSGCPPGATCSFTAAQGNSSTLKVIASSSTPNGSYTITVKGSSGSLVHSTTVSFSVTGKR